MAVGRGKMHTTQWRGLRRCVGQRVKRPAAPAAQVAQALCKTVVNLGFVCGYHIREMFSKWEYINRLSELLTTAVGQDSKR